MSHTDLLLTPRSSSSELLELAEEELNMDTDSRESLQGEPNEIISQIVDEAAVEADIEDEESSGANLQGVSLDWCLGLNFEMLNGVQNLTNDQQSKVFYTSGNTGVLFDYEHQTQSLLQGHTDAISTVAFNAFKNILVTADCGESCLMVVWDAGTARPLKTFFEPHEKGVAVVDISPCGQYLLSVGRVHESSQNMKVIEWDTDNEIEVINHGRVNLRSQEEEVTQAKFNTMDIAEFLTTSKKRIRFWDRSENGHLESYEPNMIKKDDFLKDKETSRVFVQTEFLPEEDSTQAVSATEDGQLIMWDVSLILEESHTNRHRREVKSINLLSSFNKNYQKKSTITDMLIHERSESLIL